MADKLAKFEYNLAGQFTQVDRYKSTTVSSANLIASSAYGYDLAGRLTSIVQTPKVSSASTQSWTYDTANRVASFKNTADSSTAISYTYDRDNQLTASSAITGVAAHTYEYDLNGNRTVNGSLPMTVGAGNRLDSDGFYSYTYDNEGNLIVRTLLGTGGGAERHFKYDHRNRLIEVIDYQGDDTTPVTQDVTYTYDVFNRRVSRETVNNTYVDGGEGEQQLDSTTTSEQLFFCDGDHVVIDYLSENGGSLALKHRYLYGPAVDQVLAQEDFTKSTSATDRVLWALSDNLGSIRDVLDNAP